MSRPVLALVLALAAAVLWFMFAGPARVGGARDVTFAGDRAVAAVAPAPAPVPARQNADPASGGASATAAPRADQIEVCGLGLVDQAALDTAQVGAAMARLRAESAERLEAALGQSGNAEAHALAAWLAMGDAVQRAFADAEAPCNGDEACIKAAEPAASRVAARARQPALDGLADHALTSRSPAAYAIALQACQLHRQGRCALVEARQWAQAEPDNAIPWLFVAEDAAARNDEATKLDALYHASVARTSRRYDDELVLAAAPALASLPERNQSPALMLIAGVRAGWTIPSLHVVSESCSAREVHDGNRRQLCDALATMMIDKGWTLIERGAGIRIGERSGWSGERLRALHEEREALFEAMRTSMGEPEQPWSCAAGRQTIARFLRYARLGEVDGARAEVRASGRTMQELAAAAGARWAEARQAAARAQESASEPARPASSSPAAVP